MRQKDSSFVVCPRNPRNPIDQALADFVRDKVITFEDGKKACDDFYAYKRFIAGMAASGDRGAITAMA